MYKIISLKYQDLKVSKLLFLSNVHLVTGAGGVGLSREVPCPSELSEATPLGLCSSDACL